MVWEVPVDGKVSKDVSNHDFWSQPICIVVLGSGEFQKKSPGRIYTTRRPVGVNALWPETYWQAARLRRQPRMICVNTGSQLILEDNVQHPLKLSGAALPHVTK
jgi:hypothetical protein